jgi:hypothetical protein
MAAEVAGQIRELGRRARVMQTDINDRDGINRIVWHRGYCHGHIGLGWSPTCSIANMR